MSKKRIPGKFHHDGPVLIGLFSPDPANCPKLDEERAARIIDGLLIDSADQHKASKIISDINAALAEYHHVKFGAIDLDNHRKNIDDLREIARFSKKIRKILSVKNEYSDIMIRMFERRVRSRCDIDNAGRDKNYVSIDSFISILQDLEMSSALSRKNIKEHFTSEPEHFRLRIIKHLRYIWIYATNKQFRRTTMHLSGRNGFRTGDFVQEVISQVDEIDYNTADNLIREVNEKFPMPIYDDLIDNYIDDDFLLDDDNDVDVDVDVDA